MYFEAAVACRARAHVSAIQAPINFAHARGVGEKGVQKRQIVAARAARTCKVCQALYA